MIENINNNQNLGNIFEIIFQIPKIGDQTNLDEKKVSKVDLGE